MTEYRLLSHAIEPTEKLSREVGRSIKITPMVVAGQAIAELYWQLPTEFTRENLQTLVDHALSVEMGGQPVAEDTLVDAITEEAFASQLQQLFRDGHLEADEYHRVLAALSKLHNQVDGGQSHDLDWFTDDTTLVVAPYIEQRLKPGVMSNGRIHFLRERRRDITQPLNLIQMFSGNRKPALIFLFDAVSHQINLSTLNEHAKTQAHQFLDEIAFDMIGTHMTDPEDDYLAITRLMNNRQAGSQIFYRLLRVRIDQDLADVTDNWIDVLKERALRDEVASLLRHLLSMAGEVAVKELVRIHFGSENAQSVSILERGSSGELIPVDRYRSLIEQLSYSRNLQRKRQRFGSTRVQEIFTLLTEDYHLRQQVVIALFTPQAERWLRDAARFDWRPEPGDDIFEAYVQAFLQQYDGIPTNDE